MMLEDFLKKAKKNTYASIGEAGEETLKDGSKELVFKEGEWKYRDRYYGSKTFIGEEIVWKNDDIIWAMNYYGGLRKCNFPAEKVYSFLKKAMRRIKRERPFRGPNEFTEGSFSYKDKSSGTVESFSGQESIFCRGKEIYRLKYHGGLIVFSDI